MAPLITFLNSKSLRLSVEHAGFELEEMKKLRDWFTDWRSEALGRQLMNMPAANFRQRYNGFFTIEASEDFLSMLTSIIQMTEYYTVIDVAGQSFKPFFIPRRISNDPVENFFALIRMDIGSNRQNHMCVSQSCKRITIDREHNGASKRALNKTNTGAVAMNAGEKEEAAKELVPLHKLEDFKTAIQAKKSSFGYVTMSVDRDGRKFLALNK
jgi:hypothetical protein